MIDPNIVDYIQQRFEEGEDARFIYNYLIKKGKAPKDVSDTIKYVQDIQKGTTPQQEVKSSKKIWIIFGGIAGVVIIALVIFFFMMLSSDNVLDEELLTGAYVDLKENGEMKFKLGGEEHKLIVDSIDEDSVDIIIQSEIIEVNLKINETKKFNLDGDEAYDLMVKLEKINNSEVNLFIKKINESTCVENWECGNWSECEDDIQTRTCSDLNNCRTTSNKPEIENECEITFLNDTLTCSEQGGEICDETEICDGSFLDASDSDVCCDGNCEIEEQENQSSNQSGCLTNSDCDDGDNSTQDVCDTTSEECSNTEITECVDSDDYCPSECNYTSDEDCEDSIKIACDEDIWCYHNATVETGDYLSCFNILDYWDDQDQGVVGSCINLIAIALGDCSLCDYIEKQDIYDYCVANVC